MRAPAGDMKLTMLTHEAVRHKAAKATPSRDRRQLGKQGINEDKEPDETTRRQHHDRQEAL